MTLRDEYDRTLSEIRRLGEERAAHLAEARRLLGEIIDLANGARGVVPMTHLTEAAGVSRQTLYTGIGKQ